MRSNDPISIRLRSARTQCWRRSDSKSKTPGESVYRGVMCGARWAQDERTLKRLDCHPMGGGNQPLIGRRAAWRGRGHRFGLLPNGSGSIPPPCARRRRRGIFEARRKRQMVAIVDYRAGNLTSVASALGHLGHRSEITDRPEAIRAAERVILPGVGAAGATMENLRNLGLDRVLRDDVIGAGKPFLGICIGIQVLFERSEEDAADCLEIIPGRVVRFPHSVDGRPLKAPQIGWNRVRQTRPHPLFAGVPDNSHFYFVNSYYPVPDDQEVTIATSDHGVVFTAAIARGNVMATQFHLEKSGPMGLRMLDNFCRMEF